MMETIPSGTVLNRRYRIERVLGSGGFGHVYLAIDLQTNQQFAIKEYLVSGSSGQAQLQHEASVLSHLRHPNLPTFREAFNERGHYYVVLTYIEGSDLTDIIRIARQKNDVIPLPRIMNWVLSVCDAVMFLHNQQPPIIHRDIKPDNIRITSDGTAILVDLGNAKATADGARTLFFIRHQGTPGYAPQEQYPGGSGTTVRSDVYALGGTLYFALTSHEPPSVSTRNQSIQQNIPDLPSLQDQLLNNPPEESSETNLQRQFRLGVSKPTRPAPRHMRHLAQLGTLPPPLLNQLNTIIARAMAMQQRDRYRSVADFSNDLRKVMDAIQTLPAPQRTVPPRPVDPNSTQPDLPLLYEALQSAQSGQSEQSGQPTQPSQSSQPAPEPIKPVVAPAQSNTYTCPRCGMTLVQKSAFCPRCGLSTSVGQPPNTPANSAQSPGNGGPSPQNKADASAQKINQIGDKQPKQPEQYKQHPANKAIPQAPAVPVTPVAPGIPATPSTPRSEPTSRPAVAPISTLPPVQQMKAPTNSQAQGTPKAESPLQMSTQRSARPQIQTSRALKINRQLILIAIVALVLLILITVIIILLIKQSQGEHASSLIPSVLAAQVISHERSFFTSTTALITTGLWACCTGLYIFVGGS